MNIMTGTKYFYIIKFQLILSMIIRVWRNFSLLNKTSTFVVNKSYVPSNQFSTMKTCFFVSQQLKNSNSIENYLTHQRSISILKERGINQFFPIQAQTFKYINQGKNVIGGDKTGSGKTIAFSLPIIQRLRKNGSFQKNIGIKFVILAPTRQLAVQIGDQIKSLRHARQQFQVITVFGGVPVSFNQKRLKYHPDILIGTPGRIKDLIQRKLLNFNNVEVVCVDQADYMFDIGFQQDVDIIMDNIRSNSKNNCQYLCFSATLNRKVTSFTNKYMSKNRIIVRNNQAIISPENINHCFVKVQPQVINKIEILNYLIHKKQGRVLIFTNTKRQADQISSSLKIRNVVIHGDIQQKKRLQRLNSFKKGQVRVMIASDVAARGLDIMNVQLVINYEMPRNCQSYIHRSGRTGRAGKNGVCISLVSNRKQLRQVQDVLDKRMKQQYVSLQQIEEFRKKIIQNLDQKLEKKQKQQKNNDQFSDTELILFDKQDKLTRKQIQNKLNQNEIQYVLIKSVYLQNKGQKFFIVKCKDPFNAKKALGTNIEDESNREYRFKRRIIKK